MENRVDHRWEWWQHWLLWVLLVACVLSWSLWWSLVNRRRPATLPAYHHTAEARLDGGLRP